MYSLHTLILPATPPLNHRYKTHQTVLGWDTQFQGQEPAMAPSAWQSNKAILFYFTQDPVSKVQFSTGAQRPGSQHHYQ